MLGKKASEHADTTMVAEDSGFIDEQQTLYESMWSAHTISRERWQLHVNEAARDRLFEDIMVEADRGGGGWERCEHLQLSARPRRR